MKHQNTIGLDDYEKILIKPNHLKNILKDENIFDFTDKEELANSKLILIRKKYRTFDAGFILIGKEDNVIEWQNFKDYFLRYSDIAKQRCNFNFREISLILIASDFTTEVREFCQEYNKMYDYRKPLRLINYIV